MSGATKSRGARGTMTAWLAIGVLVLTAAGCARPDWIEQTLVTVDVTGVWQGTFSGSNHLTLTLQQSGSKVTGQIALPLYWGAGRIEGPVEGTVSGDIFRFRDLRGRVTGELRVNGDEMTGWGKWSFGQVPISLSRQQ